MSLSKINPISEILELVEVGSLSLETTPASPVAVPQRHTLPNRIAVIGNYLPRQCGIATFQDVVFPCGYTIAADRDTINLYYGAADSSIALAHGSIRALLSWLDANGHSEHGHDRRHA
jgi:beta-1,4-mannooligosaccharide phosphorylase